MNKKRYAGMYWTNPTKPDKMDMKGIETVRRDSCKLVSITQQEVLNRILIERSVDSAKEYVKDTVQKLLNGKIDMSLLVLSKTLSKPEYSGVQAHVEVQKKMQKRDSGSAPVTGDRVSYVIIAGSKKDKTASKSEDPLFALENNLQLDMDYYINHQLRDAICRIFEPILPHPEQELFGASVRMTITKEVPNQTHGIMQFAKKITDKCVRCKVARSEQAGLCLACEPYRIDVMQQAVDRTTLAQEKHQTLWQECQRCANCVTQPVLCAATDCHIFFMRSKAERDLKKELDTYSRLNANNMF